MLVQDENLAQARTKFVPEFDDIVTMFYDMVVHMNDSVSRLHRVEEYLFQTPEVDEDDTPAPPKLLKV